MQPTQIMQKRANFNDLFSNAFARLASFFVNFPTASVKKFVPTLAAGFAIWTFAFGSSNAVAQSIDHNATQGNAGIPTGPTEDLNALENVRKKVVKKVDPDIDNSRNNSTFDGSHLKTSTGYKTDSLNATFSHDHPLLNASCLGLGVAANWIKGQTDDLNFSYESVNGFADCTFGPNKVSASLGVLDRADNHDSSAQTWTGRLGFEAVHEKWAVTVEGAHNVFADSLQTTYATRNLIQGLSGQFNLSLRPAKRMRAAYVQKIFFLNDRNRRDDGDLSVMYGLSPDWPWIWIGAGYERMTNSNANLGHYWAPRVFEDIGPRIDIAFPIYGELTYLMGLNCNWFRDIDYGTGFGYYGTAKLQYGQSDGRHVYIGIETIESKQAANKWDSLAWSAGVQWPF